VKLPAPKGSASLRKKAAHDEEAGEGKPHKTSRTRSQATERALKREPHSSAGKKALSRQAKSAATKRGKSARSKAAKKAARTRKSSSY
jgi:hypothetical protein